MDQSTNRKTADEWEYQFGQLRRFKAEFGHCRVPLSQPVYRPLAKWVAFQREHHGRLPLTQLRRLYDLGFDFGHPETNWLARFFELAGFKEKHGHCNVPSEWAENPSLRNWVGTQRTGAEFLSVDRARRLNELGFIWKRF